MEITSKTFKEFVADQPNGFGMVVVGAGAPFNEWVDGISGMLKDEEITEKANCFSSAYTLSDNVLGSEGRTDLVLMFDPENKPNIGKLAMWRIRFGSVMWTDDFIDNYRKEYGSWR